MKMCPHSKEEVNKMLEPLAQYGHVTVLDKEVSQASSDEFFAMMVLQILADCYEETKD